MVRASARIFAALILTWMLSGCISLPAQPRVVDASRRPSIYLVEHGWHTDIALPVDELVGATEPLKHDFPGARYLVFGFGDRRYFMTQRTTFDDILAAMFPGPSALLVTALKESPAETYGAANVVAFDVPDAGIGKIDDYLGRNFERDAQDMPIPIGDGPTPGSIFYASTGTYDAFHTCNTWSAEILRQGDLSVSTNGVVFTDQVMRQMFASKTP